MTPKTASDIRLMEQTCQLAARTLEYAKGFARPGTTLLEIDSIVHDYTLSNGATPSPLNYHGFPKSVCTSVNDVICHGVPDEYVLKEGDIINIDVTCYKNGFHGDTSATFFVGEVSARAKEITTTAFEAMHRGIEAITPNGTTGDIGFAVERYVSRKGFWVVKEIGGHGVGKEFHEDPFIPSFGKKGKGDRLIPWGTFTVEPMVNETSLPFKEVNIPGSSIKYYKTADGTLSAQFEHTVLVTDTGYQILTLA